MKCAVNSKVLPKCQAILSMRRFMKNVAAQVVLGKAKDVRGRMGLGRAEPVDRKHKNL